ncbi:MAG: hypothetical protein WCK64_07295 [Synechococcaceae cyanobacterium ELA445]
MLSPKSLCYCQNLKPLLRLLLLASIWPGSLSGAQAEPTQISIKTLAQDCQQAIFSNAPNESRRIKIIGPEVHKDKNGDLSVAWNSTSGSFYNGSDPEGSLVYAARQIGAKCKRVYIVNFSGPTGGSEKWLIRRDGFTEIHYRDSGHPGDQSKYWKWESVPFNYDPSKTY